MRTVVTHRRRRCGQRRSASPSLRPLARAYRGSGNPGGGRSYQGLVISSLTASPWRWAGLFFGGSGSDPSRGAFPFSSAENLRIGAIGVEAGGGAGEKKQAEQEGMGDMGSHPSSFIAQGRPTVDLHDRR